MNDKSQDHPIPNPAADPVPDDVGSRRRYASPTLDRYGSLMELTRAAPVPPVNDFLSSGSGGGT